eukprot:3094727-Rhodomonas_salina.1
MPGTGTAYGATRVYAMCCTAIGTGIAYGDSVSCYVAVCHMQYGDSYGDSVGGSVGCYEFVCDVRYGDSHPSQLSTAHSIYSIGGSIGGRGRTLGVAKTSAILSTIAIT